MPALPRSDWPEVLTRSFAVKGVWVGGCVVRGDGAKYHVKAHAHRKPPGWICVQAGGKLGRQRLACRELMLHELAHLVSGQGHTRRWRETLARLGGTIEPVSNILRSYAPREQQRPDHV